MLRAYDMNWINKVVPLAEVEDATMAWADELLTKSPTALRFIKAAMNADTDGLAGLQQFAGDATLLYYTFWSVGGGNVLQLVADLTVAADNAKFGQTGPMVGSFDAGYGSGYLARVIGHKRAKEVWFLNHFYTAQAIARDDARIGVIILTGAGDEAFSSGGNQKVRGNGGYVGGDGIPRLNVLDLQRLMRIIPKPIIAMVKGRTKIPFLNGV
ncbi:hypothetical protein GQS40_13675|uniref:Uncharacterized protein n=1 Tax=Leuconostoc lactis TaxID=1246 RepID=A0A6L7AE61_LEULA|nr:hypothetical protein [Leuconostoc lactis]